MPTPRPLFLIAFAIAALAVAACSDDAGSSAVDAGRDAADAGSDALADGADDTTGGDANADAADVDLGRRDGGSDVTSGDLGDVGLVELDLVDGCNPFAVSSECLFPFPSRFFTTPDERSPTGLRMAYHDDVVDLPRGAPVIHFTAFNRADGAPTSTPILLHLGVDLHPDFLVGQDESERSMSDDAPIAIFDAETGERMGPLLIEMDQNLRSFNDGRHVLIVRTLSPLDFGSRYLVVLTDELTDSEGNPLPAPPAFEALRDRRLTTSPIIEAVRDDYEDHFELLAEQGYARDELLLAWDFVTASRDYVLGPVLSMRDQALDLVDDEGVTYTIEAVDEAPNGDVLRIVEGTFEVPNWLTDEEVLEWDGDHLPIRQSERREYPFTLVLPASAADSVPMPLVVVGHGIFGSGRPLLTGREAREYFQPLADELGAVLVATDWIGLSSGDFQLLIDEVLPDLNRINVITDRLQQSLINNIVLTELALGDLAEDPQVWDGETALLDPDRVFYYGVSLGGIQGSSFVSISPRISRAVLAVPGAGWTHMIGRSTVFAPLKAVTDIVYPDPLHQQVYLAMVQTHFDHSDPVNLARLWQREPLDDAPLGRVAVLQEGIGDALVPNLATRILARTMGVDQLIPAAEAVYGLDLVSAPTDHTVLSQVLLPDNLAEYTPPDSNLIPARDNGVHADATLAPVSLAQATSLFQTGQVDHFCDGVCDPD